MIKIKDINFFWRFLYEIEGFPVPKPENIKPYFIAKRIASTIRSAIKEWNLTKLVIEDPTNSKKTFILNDKLISGSDIIKKCEEDSKLSVKVLNSILCCFFFKLKNLDSKKEAQIGELRRLLPFFENLEANSIKQDQYLFTESILIKFLEFIELKEVSPKLGTDFKLSFFRYDKNQIFSQLFTENEIYPNVKHSNNPDTIDENKIYTNIDCKNFSEKIDEYKIKLKYEFKKIRLGFSGFEIPINQIIKLPFYKIDNEKKELLDNLKKELQNLEDTNDIEKIARLEKEINKIEGLLSKPYNSLETLNSGKDIFILSPAGFGKTTTLRWFAYTLASNVNKLPIFIELQSYKSNLKDLINDNLDFFNIELDSINENQKIVLLIDGFDEYSGEDQALLVKEINNFKKKTSCQIIFSGRYKPNDLDEKDFYTYELSAFDENDIRRIMTSIFPKKGKYYFDELKKVDLLNLISTPLFLMFLIIHLKKEKKIELSTIRVLLENKGVLLKTVLIDDFLYSYEYKGNKELKKYRWVETKKKQIEIISLFAYYLSFELKNKENAHCENDGVIEYLTTKPTSTKQTENCNYKEIFNDFNEHSILSFKRDFVGFDKKEIRLFFTSYYLVNQIKNIKDYQSFKKLFKGDSNSWASIDKYIFGLMDPNLLMKELKSFTIKDQLIYSKSLIDQLDYAHKFIQSGNFNHKYEILNKPYFLNIIVMIFFNHLKFEHENKRITKIWFNEFFFIFLKNLNFFKKKYPFLTQTYNYYFIFGFYKYPNITYKLREFLRSSESDSSFKNIKLNHKNYRKLSYSMNQSKILVSNIDKSPNLIFSFIDNLIFCSPFNGSFYSRNVSAYQDTLNNMIYFLEDFFKLNANSYLDYYLKTHNPTIFNLKTLYLFLLKFQIKISSDKILPKTKEKIFYNLNYIVRYGKNGKNITKIFEIVFYNILDNNLKNELLNSWRNEIITDGKANSNIRRLLVNIYKYYPNKNDLDFFISILDDKNVQYKNSAIWALSAYLSRQHLEVNLEVIRGIDTKLHNLFKKSDFNQKLMLITIFELFKTHPSKDFRVDIVGFAKKTDVQRYVIIKYFGRSKIKESIPFLNNLLYEENSFSLLAFEALVNINPENYFIYNTEYLKSERSFMEKCLSDLKNTITEKPLTEIEKNLLKKSLQIGNESTLYIVKEIYENAYKNKALTKKNKKLIQEIYLNLKTNISQLRETDYYKNNLLIQ